MQVANAAYTQSAAVKPFKEGDVEWVVEGRRLAGWMGGLSGVVASPSAVWVRL